MTVTGQVTSGYKQDGGNPTVRVYKYTGKEGLAESVFADLSKMISMRISQAN